jgi:[acyl-carrier-protein] S-malonyltransferase
VTSPVLWEKTMQTLFSRGLTRSYEIGPGKVVAGIAKRMNKEHEIANIIA